MSLCGTNYYFNVNASVKIYPYWHGIRHSEKIIHIMVLIEQLVLLNIILVVISSRTMLSFSPDCDAIKNTTFAIPIDTMRDQ